jgi:hypothetical protein
MLLLAACAPGKPQDETTPPDKTEPPTGSQATVESVKINILEADPPVIQVTASGHLPDAGCTSISAIEQKRKGSDFYVTISTATDPDVMCAQVLTPFDQVIELEAEGLAPGQYHVIVNGVEVPFEI